VLRHLHDILRQGVPEHSCRCVLTRRRGGPQGPRSVFPLWSPHVSTQHHHVRGVATRHPEANKELRAVGFAHSSTSRGDDRTMLKIGQGGQVVDATGEGVRLRPLAATLFDASEDGVTGSRLRAADSGLREADPSGWPRPASQT
jgi:hypothetical protein